MQTTLLYYSTGLTNTGAGPLCDIQRLESIIDDCERSDYGTTTIQEMLVVTHYWHRNTESVSLTDEILVIKIYISSSKAKTIVISGLTELRKLLCRIQYA